MWLVFSVFDDDGSDIVAEGEGGDNFLEHLAPGVNVVGDALVVLHDAAHFAHVFVCELDLVFDGDVPDVMVYTGFKIICVY